MNCALPNTMSSTRNLSSSSAAHAGSSVRLLMATFVALQSSVVLSCRRMSLAAPSKTTRSPDCASIASPSGVNGAPPRHDSIYISGSQRHPSRSNTTTFGFACIATSRRAVGGCMKALQRCSTSAAMACFMAHCSYRCQVAKCVILQRRSTRTMSCNQSISLYII